jgi:N-acyl-D-amino-acid deacylase
MLLRLGTGALRSAALRGFVLLGFASLVLPCPAPAQSYDVIIRHGRVVDGTGNPAFFADVAVNHGHIAGIGKLAGTAKTEIDAQGLVVAPGFIDVHTHADDVAEMPRAENFVRMGVTTIVAGNCGGSGLDIARFFRGIEETNVALNVATLVPCVKRRWAAVSTARQRQQNSKP